MTKIYLISSESAVIARASCDINPVRSESIQFARPNVNLVTLSVLRNDSQLSRLTPSPGDVRQSSTYICVAYVLP